MAGPGLGIGLGLGTQLYGPAGPHIGPIISSTISAAGINWQVNDTFFLASYSGDATFIVNSVSIAPTAYALTDIVPHTFGVTITAVNQGTKTFTASIDITTNLVIGLSWEVQGSTGNDGTYTVASFALNGSETDIVVTQAIPDATADGFVTSYGVMAIAGNHVAEFIDGLFVVAANTGGLNGGYHYQSTVTDFNFGGNGWTRVFMTAASEFAGSTVDGNLLLLHQATVITYTMTDPGTAYETANGVVATGGAPGVGTGLALNIVV